MYQQALATPASSVPRSKRTGPAPQGRFSYSRPRKPVYRAGTARFHAIRKKCDPRHRHPITKSPYSVCQPHTDFPVFSQKAGPGSSWAGFWFFRPWSLEATRRLWRATGLPFVGQAAKVWRTSQTNKTERPIFELSATHWPPCPLPKSRLWSFQSRLLVFQTSIPGGDQRVVASDRTAFCRASRKSVTDITDKQDQAPHIRTVSHTLTSLSPPKKPALDLPGPAFGILNAEYPAKKRKFFGDRPQAVIL